MEKEREGIALPQVKASRINTVCQKHYEQLYSSASDREKKQTKKTMYNKHRNTIDMEDYQAVTCV